MFGNVGFAFQNFKVLPKIDLYLGADVDTFARSMYDHSYHMCRVSSWNNETTRSWSNLDFSYPDPFIDFAKNHRGTVSVTCLKNKYIFTNLKNEPQQNEFLLTFVACRGIIVEYDVSAHFRFEDFGLNPEPFQIWSDFFKHFSNKSPEIKKYENDFKASEGNIWRKVNDSIAYDDNKNDILFYLSRNYYYFKRHGPGTGGTGVSIMLVSNSDKKHKACW